MDPQLLQSRKNTTTALYTDPHNPHLYLERGLIHERLGFPDLASADAYRALSLLESVVDPEGCEFHARKRVTPTANGAEGKSAESGSDEDDEEDAFAAVTKPEYDALIGDVYELLVRGLVSCACFRDAFEFCLRGIELFGGLGRDEKPLREAMGVIRRNYYARRERLDGRPCVKGKEGEVEVDPRLLNAQGVARRVLYPWNEHEPDRKAPQTLELLNERLKAVAPKCEVKAVALPALHGTVGSGTEGAGEDVSIQLGVFAKEDIAADEILLRETSLLTATNRLHDDLCDACNSPLPDLSSENPPVPCENHCEDTIFCSPQCHDQAQETYHGAICGMEGLASIGRDIPDPKDKADYLYLLLVGRAIAMAATQETHPLDLPEVKYIWGDFHDLEAPSSTNPDTAKQDPTATLPFSFQLNIVQPTRLLEEMGLDPYATLPQYDTWVLNTLYAKFRGTASGRLSTWDGGPELCAVHPLWCLANHSCDPNVRWEWGGEITFRARSLEERPVWKRGGEEKRVGKEGIGMGEEILNHYCDVDLSVKERREWAVGALGGLCLCERCVWEDS